MRNLAPRSGPRGLTDALAARGLAAEVSGRSVRAWMPGREYIAVLVMPGWHTDPRRGRLARRVWSWHRNNVSAWRPRAGAAGVAVGVAALLLRSGRPDEPPDDADGFK